MVLLTTEFIAVALLTVAVQALTPEDVQHELAPYTKVIGAIVIALGLLLAFSGKRVMRLYLAIVGFLFGAIMSYLTLERIAKRNDLGPNKDLIEMVVAFVAGLIGMGLGLFVSQLAVFAMGALFGLILTVGLLNIPGMEHIRETLPVWSIILIIIVASMFITYFLESYLYIGLTAIIGAFAAACGLDALLETGFNEEVLKMITSETHKIFKLTKAMHPILIAFLVVIVLGSLSQCYLLHRHYSYEKAHRERCSSVDIEHGRGVQARMY